MDGTDIHVGYKINEDYHDRPTTSKPFRYQWRIQGGGIGLWLPFGKEKNKFSHRENRQLTEMQL